MSETLFDGPKPRELFRPGDVILIPDMVDFEAFEDGLSQIVDPNSNPQEWLRRPTIKDILRPAKFNGPIRDISLTVMEDPYEQLLTANDRGWKLAKSPGSKKRTAEHSDLIIERYLGFQFVAQAVSSSPSMRGEISSELWYYPAAYLHVNAGDTSRNRYVYKTGEVREYESVAKKERWQKHNDRGEAIRRVVAKPKYEKGVFERGYEQSRAIGFTVVQQAMKNAITTPVNN